MAGWLRSAGILTLALLAPAAPAVAAPQWVGGGQLLAPNDDIATNPQVALEPAGDAVAVWVQDVGGFARIVAATRPAGGAFSGAAPISPAAAHSSQPQIGMDAAGNATVAWFNGTTQRIQAAVRPAGGAFGAPVPVSGPGVTVFSLALAVGPNGDAVAAWHNATPNPDAVQAAVRPAGGTFGSVQPVSSGMVQFPHAGIDAGGNATVAWRNASTERIEVSTRPAGGAFSAASPVSTSGQNALIAALGVGAGGHTVVVWSRADSDPDQLRARHRAPGGAFGGVDIVSGATGGLTSGFDVAVAPNGEAIVTWLEGTNPFRPNAAVRAPGGFFPLGTPLSAASGSSTAVAHGPSGRAIALWLSSANGRAQGAVRDPGGAFGPAADVSPAAPPSPGFAQPALDAQGNGIAIWAPSVPPVLPDIFFQYGVAFAGYDGAGPQLRDQAFPASGGPGSPLDFSVAPVDVWSPPVSTGWRFGDGGSADGTAVSHAYGSPGTFEATVTATDALGNESSAMGLVSVAAPAGPSGQTAPEPAAPAAPADSARPALSRVTMTRRRFRVGRAATPVSARRASTSRAGTPVSAQRRTRAGSAFRFSLSAAAQVAIAIERARPGRRVGRRCRPPARRLRNRRRCTRYVRVRMLTRSARAGSNRVAFSGRIGRRALAPGGYRATVVATDAAGNRSVARRVTFRIVRR